MLRAFCSYPVDEHFICLARYLVHSPCRRQESRSLFVRPFGPFGRFSFARFSSFAICASLTQTSPPLFVSGGVCLFHSSFSIAVNSVGRWWVMTDFESLMVDYYFPYINLQQKNLIYINMSMWNFF